MQSWAQIGLRPKPVFPGVKDLSDALWFVAEVFLWKLPFFLSEMGFSDEAAMESLLVFLLFSNAFAPMSVVNV